jgi:hypothetical protein
MFFERACVCKDLLCFYVSVKVLMSVQQFWRDIAGASFLLPIGSSSIFDGILHPDASFAFLQMELPILGESANLPPLKTTQQLKIYGI